MINAENSYAMIEIAHEIHGVCMQWIFYFFLFTSGGLWFFRISYAS